eukprot:12316257-Alexandrium_andersonii.AAC.1
MSASLVGSEMCIRDSSPTLQPRPASSATSPSSGTTLRVSGLNTSPQPRPVSYTHLTLPTICSV